MSEKLTKLALQHECLLKVVNKVKSLQMILTGRDKKIALLEERINEGERGFYDYRARTSTPNMSHNYSQGRYNRGLLSLEQQVADSLQSQDNIYKTIYLSQRKSEKPETAIISIFIGRKQRYYILK